MDEEKDKQIERLFDHYASTLEPNTSLADKARQKIRKSAERQPKRRAWVLGVAAACAVVVLTALFVVPFIGNDRADGGYTDNTTTKPNLPPVVPSQVRHYSISDVRASRVDADFAKQYISTELPAGANIFSENYYACYIKETDEFAYLRAVLGVSYNGGNIQMSIVAEKSEYAGNELATEYKYVMKGTGYRSYTEYINGEYVTVAYCAKSDCKYYVTTVGNADGGKELAQSIVKSE